MLTRRSKESTEGGVYYGWYVVAAVFIIMMTTSGLGFYAQGLFLKALVDEQGFSVSAAGAFTGVFFAVSGVTGYFIAKPFGAYDARITICIGAVLSALGLFLLGEVRVLWQALFANAVFGVGFAAAGLVPGTTLVTRWFTRRRSVALSVASTGLSMGGIVLTPVVAFLIDERTLSSMAKWFALAVLVGVIPICIGVVRSQPSELGLLPDGDRVQAGAPPQKPTGSPLEQARGSRFFVGVTAAYILIMGSQVGAIQHLVKLTDERAGDSAAQKVVVFIAATSVMGRLAGGVVAQKVPLKLLIGALVIVQALGILLLSRASSSGTIFLSAVVLGLAIGNLLMLHPLLLADAFGVADYGRIYGLSNLFMTIGVGGGPALLGVLRDSNDYTFAYAIAAVASLIGLGVFASAGRPAMAWQNT